MAYLLNGRFSRSRGEAPTRQVWSAAGEALARSSHHHGAVRALVVQPPSLPGGGATSVWTGGADGVVYAWRDARYLLSLRLYH